MQEQSYVVSINNPTEITPAQNLLILLMSGLLPEQLDKNNVALLEAEFGEDWFEDMGYNDVNYKRPAQ